jgi:serine/threonine-protein kinase
VAAGIPLGPYVLVRRLATGGMAEIFLARREGPEGFARELVAKRILPHLAQDPAFTAMFLEEARIAAKLTHPNVVQVYDFGEVDGSWYLAMELVRGVDLRALIERSVRQAYHERRPGAIPAHHAAKIMSLVCEGLAHAHAVVIDGQRAGLVHRDVSPSNVLISFEGAVKVADFGIAKADTGKSRDDTRIGLVKGKYAYMSPEQARGERLDARSDLFNVGTLLFESITGDTLMPHHDYRASKLMSAAGRIPHPERIDQLPPKLAEVCTRALAADREHRYRDALSLRADLEVFLRTCEEPSDQVEIGRYVRSLFRDVMEEDKRAPRAAGSVPQTEAGTPDLALDATALDPLGPTAHAKKNVGPRQVDVKTEPMAAETPQPLPPLRGMPPPARPRRPIALLAAGAGVLAALGFGLGYVALRADAAPEAPDTPPSIPPPPDPSALAPPAPPPAELRVTSDPPGLDVYVDGERVGPAPLVLTLPSGEPHRIELRGDGGVLSSEEVTLEPGAPSTLELAPDPPRLASLRIVTVPESATVRVDGEERGQTPIAIEIEPGEHEVEVSADGYEPQSAIASLSNANETATLSFVLIEEPVVRTGPRRPRPTGTLVIATTPWSEVYLGGRRLGTTPLGNVRLPAGRHTLTLRAQGRPPRRHSVTIRADEETRVRLTL